MIRSLAFEDQQVLLGLSRQFDPLPLWPSQEWYDVGKEDCPLLLE